MQNERRFHEKSFDEPGLHRVDSEAHSSTPKGHALIAVQAVTPTNYILRGYQNLNYRSPKPSRDEKEEEDILKNYIEETEPAMFFNGLRYVNVDPKIRKALDAQNKPRNPKGGKERPWIT